MGEETSQILSLTALLSPGHASGQDTAQLGLNQRIADIMSTPHSSHIYSFVIWPKPSHC